MTRTRTDPRKCRPLLQRPENNRQTVELQLSDRAIDQGHPGADSHSLTNFRDEIQGNSPRNT